MNIVIIISIIKVPINGTELKDNVAMIKPIEINIWKIAVSEKSPFNIKYEKKIVAHSNTKVIQIRPKMLKVPLQ